LKEYPEKVIHGEKGFQIKIDKKMSEKKVLSVEEQLRKIFEDEIKEEKRLSKIFKRRSRVYTRERIKFINKLKMDVLSVLKQHRTPEQKELLALWKERPKTEDIECFMCHQWIDKFVPKFEAFLSDCALREAELLLHLYKFPAMKLSKFGEDFFKYYSVDEVNEWYDEHKRLVVLKGDKP